MSNNICFGDVFLNTFQAKAAPPSQTKAASPVLQSMPKAMNGTKNGSAGEARPGQVDVQRCAPPEAQTAEHVTIKKKPKCKCCIIQ